METIKTNLEGVYEQDIDDKHLTLTVKYSMPRGLWHEYLAHIKLFRHFLHGGERVYEEYKLKFLLSVTEGEFWLYGILDVKRNVRPQRKRYDQALQWLDHFLAPAFGPGWRKIHTAEYNKIRLNWHRVEQGNIIQTSL